MIGTKLAHFEITSHLGSGGMGDVYQATDSKLGRSVAIKFLPEAFSHDGERVARFQREARVLASLNHPNIAGIHGVEEINGRHFLIMELVPGETLADRIQRGAMSIEEALPIAKQMAEALEEAHDKGVIHRDLKPANIKVTPDGKVKVLDFGLAKAFERDQPDAALSNSPTMMSMGGTQAGVILGTAAYMAPEQARGKSVDKRADIWAFGVVLYEMVTRTQPFRGADLTDILAAVVRDKPDLSAAPQQLRRVLEACLQKDPRDRLRDIADIWKVLDDEPAVRADGGSPRHRGSWLWPGVAAALAVIAAIGYWAPWRETQPADRPLLRFSADLGPEAERAPHNTVILSPDGTRMAYTARGEGGMRVYTRRLDQPDATLLVTSAAALPDLFFSPNGEWIGFVAGDRNLKKVAVQGGSAITVGAMPVAQQSGMSWGDDDNIVIGTLDGLWSLPAAGGVARRLTDVAAGYGHFPDVLPGAKAVLFNTRPQATNSMDGFNIEVLEFAGGNKRALVEGGYFPRYVPTSVETGHLLYMKGGTLFAVGFDPRSLALLGTPLPLLSDVAASTDMVTGGGQFAASDTGILVYLGGNIAGDSYPLQWMDAAGKTTPLLAQPGVYGAPRLSPDGRQLAYIASGNGGFDVWVTDVASGTPSQLTFLGTVNWELAWAPDSRHLVYGDGKALWWIRSDGGGQAQLLADNQPNPRPTSFAPLVGKDTRLLFISSKIGVPDLWTLPIDLSDPERPRAGKPEPFLADAAMVEVDGAFSPDGKFIAYSSNESGSPQIFVRPFPGPGGRWKVSTAAGQFPAWSPATRELFFLGNDRIMAVSYAIEGSGGREDSFSVVGTPRVWSSQPVRRDSVRQNFDVSRDGKRVVMFPKPAVENAGGNLHATFLLNFFDEVRRRAPADGKK